MNFSIDKKSGVPLYRQVIKAVTEAIHDGSLKNGDALPSLNDFAAGYGISMETAKKAYNRMKKDGLLSGRQGKGYFVDIREDGAPLKILMLLDKLSAYKLSIHQGLTSALEVPSDVTIQVHNQDISLFEKMISDAFGNFDYYLIAPHFRKDVPSSRIVKALKKLPNAKMILLDRNIPEYKGNIGRIYQDFSYDAVTALESGFEGVVKYSSVCIVDSGNGLYSNMIIPGIRSFLKSHHIKNRTVHGFKTGLMTPGTLYIVLGGQLDTAHFAILREALALGYTLGKAVGLISYNDEPVNEFICGGLTCLSSDFYQMGKTAAEMINSGRMWEVHNPFSLILRASL